MGGDGERICCWFHEHRRGLDNMAALCWSLWGIRIFAEDVPTSYPAGPLAHSPHPGVFPGSPHPSQPHTTWQQASGPPGFWMLDSCHTPPCLLPQTNVSPACSAGILLSVLFPLWFHHNQTHQAAFRSPVWSGLHGAQQRALSSCPWPTWPSPMNGPEWEIMLVCNPYHSKWKWRKRKRKKKAKPNIPAELRFWFAWMPRTESWLILGTVLAAGINSVSFNLISQPLIESCSVKSAQGTKGDKALFIIIGSPLTIHLAVPGITWWAFMLFTAYKKVVLLWFNI